MIEVTGLSDEVCDGFVWCEVTGLWICNDKFVGLSEVTPLQHVTFPSYSGLLWWLDRGLPSSSTPHECVPPSKRMVYPT